MELVTKTALVLNAIRTTVLTSVPFGDAFRVLIMLGCIPMYIHEMRRLKDMLDFNVFSPRERALSFRRFVRDYAAASDFRSIICGCVMIAATVAWLAESRQPYVASDWTFSQAFLVVAVTYALSGQALTLLITRGLWTVALSRGHAERWAQHAAHSLASRYINVSIVLATPEAWTKGAVIFFVASQIASTLHLEQSQDILEGGGRLLQYATLFVSALVVCHSLLMTRVFCRLVSLSSDSALEAAPRWGRTTRSGSQLITPH